MQYGLVELFLPATARNTALVLEQLALRSEMETICYRCMWRWWMQLLDDQWWLYFEMLVVFICSHFPLYFNLGYNEAGSEKGVLIS